MRKIWPIIYFLLAIPCLVSGFGSLLPENTADTNADWIFITITFVSCVFFPLGAMAFSRFRGTKTFRKPSLDRHPFGWWNDTLQPLRVSWASMALIWLASCLAFPKTDHNGVMLFWFYMACAFGLFIGERIIYRVYRKQIV